MTKYFELLVDLLNIPDNEKYIEIAKVIESNIDRDIQVHHQYFFIFEGYRDFLKGKISQEDFLQLGDIGSKLRFSPDRVDSITFLNSNPKIKKDIIYIFDSLAEGIIPEQDNIFYC